MTFVHTGQGRGAFMALELTKIEKMYILYGIIDKSMCYKLSYMVE